MNDSEAWTRFRERIVEGTQQSETLKAWRQIAELTRLPERESLEQLGKLVIQKDEAAFLLFRNAMVLVNNTYGQRAGLQGVQDPDAPQYENFLKLRAALDGIRKPIDQAPPYSPEEFALSTECNELFTELAIVLNRASPEAASQEVVDELAALSSRYRNLLAEAKPENRARRQALDALAQATYAIGRTHLILKDYPEATQCFESAIELFEALGDARGAQAGRQQLAALSILRGNVDAALRANLEVLTGEKGEARSLQQATALVGQLTQTLKVGDAFEAGKLLKSAVAEISRLYMDPGVSGIEPSFANWVEMVPADLRGNDFLLELAQVVQLYAAISGARARLNQDPPAQEELAALLAMMDRMFSESLDADEDLQRRFVLANARPLAAPATAAGS